MQELNKAVLASQDKSAKPAGGSSGAKILSDVPANGPLKRKQYNNPIEKVITDIYY